MESKATLIGVVHPASRAHRRRPGIERPSIDLSVGVAGVSLLVLGLLVLGLDAWAGTALLAVGLAPVAYAWRRSSAALAKRAPLRAVAASRRFPD